MVKDRHYPAESGNHRHPDLGQEHRAVRRVRFVPDHPAVNDNYADVYHGVREGYSGGYQPDGSSFSYSVNTGDIYSYMDGVLGTEDVRGSHVKYAGDALEYRLSGLDVTIRNAPLAPSYPKNAQRFEADAVILLEVPVYFGGKELAPMKIKLKVQAGYTEVF